MYREVTVRSDKEFLLAFWQNEQMSAKWYKQICLPDEWTDDDYFKYCDDHRIFDINGVALLFVQQVRPNIARIHFSTLRGKATDILTDLKKIRARLFAEGNDIVFGYILRTNYPLKKVCRQLGLEFNGLEIRKEREDKRELVEECFAVHRNSFIKTESLLV